MRGPHTVRFVSLTVLGAACAVTFGLGTSGRSALAARSTRMAEVVRLQTPLGKQGTRGAGGNVGIIFGLRDVTRRKTDVERQETRRNDLDERRTKTTERKAVDRRRTTRNNE